MYVPRSSLRLRGALSTITAAALLVASAAAPSPAAVAVAPLSVGSDTEALFATDRAPSPGPTVGGSVDVLDGDTQFVALDPATLRERLTASTRTANRDAARCLTLTARDVAVELPDGRTVALAGGTARECPVEGKPILQWSSRQEPNSAAAVHLRLATVTRADGTKVALGVLQEGDTTWQVLPTATAGTSALVPMVDAIDGPEDEGGGAALVAEQPDVPAGRSGPAGRADDAPSSDDPGDAIEQDPIPRGAGAKQAMRVIDVLFPYANGVSAETALLSAAQAAVMADQAFANSGVAARVGVVGVRAVGHTRTADLNPNLYALEDPNHPSFRAVHEWRDQLAADVVTLIVPGGCEGVARAPSVARGNDTKAFAVITPFGCDGTVFPHELGHILGSMHDPDNARRPDGTLHRGSFPWAFGHRVSGVASDIMAYDNCPSACPEVLQYADADTDFLGHPGVRSGTATRDADRAIDDTIWAVSQYRPVRQSNDVIRFGRRDRGFAPFTVNADPSWIPNAPGTPHDVEALYTPVRGDFDGSGTDDIVWYYAGDQPDQVWFSKIDPHRGTYDVGSRTIDGSYRPVAGDFDGDDHDDLFLYAPGAGNDLVWWGVPGDRKQFSQVRTPYTVSGNYFPMVSDFDADGFDDVFWYAPGSAKDTIWWGGPSRSFTESDRTVSGLYVPTVGDFQGDGAADILWYAPGAGADIIWWGRKASRVIGSADQRTVVVNGDYRPASGDFDADGRADIFWHGPGGAADSYWWGTTDPAAFGGAASSTPTVASGDHDPVAGDLDGDGSDDLYLFTLG